MNKFIKYKRFLTTLVLFCFVLSAFIIPVSNSKIYAQSFSSLIRSSSIAEALGVAVAGISAISVNSYSNIKGVVDDVYDKGTDILNSVKSTISSGVSNFTDLFRSTRSETYSHYEPTFGITNYSYAEGYSGKEVFDWSTVGMPTSVTKVNLYFENHDFDPNNLINNAEIIVNYTLTFNNGETFNARSRIYYVDLRNGKLGIYTANNSWDQFILTYRLAEGLEKYAFCDKYSSPMSPWLVTGDFKNRLNEFSYDYVVERGSAFKLYRNLTVEKEGVKFSFPSGGTDFPPYLIQAPSISKGKVTSFMIRGSIWDLYTQNLLTENIDIEGNTSTVVSDGTNTYSIEEAEAEGLAVVESVVGGTADTYDEETYQQKLNDVITLGSAGTGLLTGEGISEGIGGSTIDLLLEEGVISSDGNIVPENLANIDELINTTTDQVLQDDLTTFKDAYIRQLEIELENALVDTGATPINPETVAPEGFFDWLKWILEQVWETLKSILNVLNPASDLFLIKNLFLTDLKLPDMWNIFLDDFYLYFPFLGSVIDAFNNILNIDWSETGPPEFVIDLPLEFGGVSVNIIDFSFYTEYRDFIFMVMRFFLWFVFIKKTVARLTLLITDKTLSNVGGGK